VEERPFCPIQVSIGPVFHQLVEIPVKVVALGGIGVARVLDDPLYFGGLPDLMFQPHRPGFGLRRPAAERPVAADLNLDRIESAGRYRDFLRPRQA
jgi:hypothetical protein